MTRTENVADPVRQAAAETCKKVQDLAAQLAGRLKGPGDAPANAVATVLLKGGKIAAELRKQLDALPRDGGA